jgi:hypothetical protein
MNGLTKQEFSLYSLLFLKFGSAPFGLDSVKWYFSPQMLKKLFHNLTRAGWLSNFSRGKYVCSSPVDAVKSFFEPTVEGALSDARKLSLEFAFFGASAVDVWSDGTYKQDSWEKKPFFVLVLRKDLKGWNKFFSSKQIQFFSEPKQNILGEFVVLKAVDSFKSVFHDGVPVISLQETVSFCEKNKALFEYPLAYFANKYKVKTSASKEMLLKAKEAII